MKDKIDIQIEDIITEESVLAHYQPIVSIRRKQIIGFEALARGIHEDGSLISPLLMIEEAEKYGFILELDRLFRKKALEGFKIYHRGNSGAILFVNMNSSAIESGLGSKHFITAVEKSGIPPSSVVMEILESEVEDINVLTNFVRSYRSLGFMIAMDDFGAGFSNWDRIIKLKPDLIKLDMSIVRDIDSDFFKQEVARSLIRLSHNTGSLVVGEGVETEAEAMKLLELGVDMLQGFYFSKPSDSAGISHLNIFSRIDALSDSLRLFSARRGELKASVMKNYYILTDDIIAKLRDDRTDAVNLNSFNLQEIPGRIECIYILDEYGIQLSETVMNENTSTSGRGRIFRPDDIYCDQSNKDYFFNLINGLDIYISEPYISAATGNRCITISRKYTGMDGKKRILCVDLKHDGAS